jgi:DNA adenine methylase
MSTTATTLGVKPRSFVKWAGGKQAIAENIQQFFPKKYDRYFEPFIGGGSVLFSVLPHNAVIGDLNSWLVDTYRAIKADPAAVISIIDSFENSKEEFLKIREQNPYDFDLFERGARFIYLNKTCFRGLFRVNRKGKFNVPYGDYSRRLYDEHEIYATSEYLKLVDIREGGYETTLSGIKSNDFTYLDPPYYKQGGYSDFNRYTKEQFNEYDQMELSAFCRELHSRGVKFAQSNSDTPLIRTLYRDFSLVPVENRREINLKSSQRTIQELLILNY